MIGKRVREAESAAAMRKKCAEAIQTKAEAVKGGLMAVMAKPGYAMVPATHKTGLEQLFHKVGLVESQAKACSEDSKKPLPDDAKTLADILALGKQAKKETSNIEKLLKVMSSMAVAGA